MILAALGLARTRARPSSLCPNGLPLIIESRMIASNTRCGACNVSMVPMSARSSLAEKSTAITGKPSRFCARNLLSASSNRFAWLCTLSISTHCCLPDLVCRNSKTCLGLSFLFSGG
jgi:hypothetical protein